MAKRPGVENLIVKRVDAADMGKVKTALAGKSVDALYPPSSSRNSLACRITRAYRNIFCIYNLPNKHGFFDLKYIKPSSLW